jgi:hypothetical protein
MIVFWVLSPVKAAVLVLVQQGLLGLYLGASFAPNHERMPILNVRRQDRLSAAASADVAQHPRRQARRPRPRSAELPDRTPPVPEHAQTQSAPG